MFFCLVVGGFTLPTPVVIRPLKKTLFLCVFSLNTSRFWAQATEVLGRLERLREADGGGGG